MKRSGALAALLVAVVHSAAFAGTVSFFPQKDNSIYLDLQGQLSNGQGVYLFSGRTSNDLLRRALVKFDLSSIPINAVVTDATFSLFSNRPRPNDSPVPVSLNRALRDWGEGASNAGEPGGIGAQAEPNDATWLHTFYPNSFWTTLGGDFSSTASAITPVADNGTYTWNGSGLIGDIQSWVSNPTSNFGWFILGTEMISGSAQRFNSRENTDNPPQLTVTYQVAPTILGNFSTRLQVGTANDVPIGGAIATGPQTKRVIFRAIGPSLSQFGLTGALADPTIDLYQGDTLLFSNDDWRNSTQESQITSSGFAPTNDAEAAIIWTLTPNQSYSAIVRGKNGSTGIGLAEIFDLDRGAASKLVNVSTRGFVGPNDSVLIAGFIVVSGSGAPSRLLARALGPTLADLGLPGTLADPTVDLLDSNGVVIRSNDNWRDSQSAEIEATGLAPNHDAEAALVENLIPGSYTLITRGTAQTTGLALLELYDIPDTPPFAATTDPSLSKKASD